MNKNNFKKHPENINNENLTENSSENSNENSEIATIIDKNGTIYMGIYNFFVSFCYYISAIQRLHSSRTLKEVLKKGLVRLDDRSESKDIHNITNEIFKILVDYNKIEDIIIDIEKTQKKETPIKNNLRGAALKKYLIKRNKEAILGGDLNTSLDHIYKEIKSYEKTITNLISERLKHGGDPQEIMVKLFLPIIFHYTDDSTFLEILQELNFSLLHFKNTNYDINSFDIIKDNKENYNGKLFNWYKEILKYKDRIGEKVNENTFNNQFCVSTLCIFFKSVYERDYSGNSGHAVSFVLGNDDKFYVIDDDVNIMLFENYIKMFESRIFEMEIKDLTTDAVQLLSEIDYLNVDHRIYRTVIKFKDRSVKSLTGGETNEINNDGLIINDENENPLIIVPLKDKINKIYSNNKLVFNIYFGFIAVLIVILIIVVIT